MKKIILLLTILLLTGSLFLSIGFAKSWFFSHLSSEFKLQTAVNHQPSTEMNDGITENTPEADQEQAKNKVEADKGSNTEEQTNVENELALKDQPQEATAAATQEIGDQATSEALED